MKQLEIELDHSEEIVMTYEFTVVTWSGDDVQELTHNLLQAARNGFVNANYPEHGWTDQIIVLTKHEVSAEVYQQMFDEWVKELEGDE